MEVVEHHERWLPAGDDVHEPEHGRAHERVVERHGEVVAEQDGR